MSSVHVGFQPLALGTRAFPHASLPFGVDSFYPSHLRALYNARRFEIDLAFQAWVLGHLDRLAWVAQAFDEQVITSNVPCPAKHRLQRAHVCEQYYNTMHTSQSFHMTHTFKYYLLLFEL